MHIVRERNKVGNETLVVISGNDHSRKDRSTSIWRHSKISPLKGKNILGADATDEQVPVSGWQEESKEELIPFIQSYRSNGIEYVICTDISKDGMLEGPSFDLYRKILESINESNETSDTSSLKLIASGGISMFEELPRLAELGCEGTIIGKAIYENRISLKQLETYILGNG